MDRTLDAQTAIAAVKMPRPRAEERSSPWVSYGLLALLASLIIPAFAAAHLPVRIDLLALAGAYWGGTAVRAVFVAATLALLGSPVRTFVPMLERYHREKIRFLIVSFLCLWMFGVFGLWFGSMLVIDAIAIAELMEREQSRFGAVVLDILAPSAYLFLGVLLVYLLNHAIAGIRFAGSYDKLFERADHVVFHSSVSAASHWMIGHLPTRFFSSMEIVYFSLFGQVGAVIIIAAIKWGRSHAMRYVVTLLIAYAMALACFFLWPSIGPFSIYSASGRAYLRSLPTYWTQQAILSKALLLNAHKLIPAVITVNLADYYIGFPSMHIALPAIAIWFVRKWRRVALVLLGFDALLVLSIIALQWHYFVDLAGGLAVAVIAIFIDEILHSTQR